MKLAFVVQRYGADIAGGSEAHCRALALRLRGRHDITVLTTCARDYVSWANEMPAGVSDDHGVAVRRFRVRRRRNLSRFGEVSDEVFSETAAPARQVEWFAENGPDVPELLEHLRQRGPEYDLVLFWTFRYAPSFFGLPLVQTRAVLLPTAEEDPALRLPILQEYFCRPAGYLFLTPEEQQLVSARAGVALEPAAVIGMGLDPAPPVSGPLSPPADLPARFVLYLGRVDRNKGCETLLQYYEEYLQEGGDVTLVLAGPSKIPIPAHPRIRALGYVSDALRDALLARASVIVIPSPYESLSIVLLEAWNHGVPALVNARCQVLRGQVRRANGGLHYASSLEFREGLARLLSRDEERAAIGRQGLDYVNREYRWPVVLARVDDLLARVHARASQAAAKPV